MRFASFPGQATFFLSHPKRKAEVEMKFFYDCTRLEEVDARRVCDAMCVQAQSLKLGSQSNLLHYIVKPWFTFLSQRTGAYPLLSSDWQILILDFYEFYLTDSQYAKTNAAVRMIRWKKVRNFLSYLQEIEIIPTDVYLPEIRDKPPSSTASDRQILTEKPNVVVRGSEEPSKLVISLDFAMTDSEYLFTVEKKCRKAIDVIKETCLKHWHCLMEDGETGRKLAQQVDLNRLDEISRDPISLAKISRPCSPSTNEGCQNALAFARRLLVDGYSDDCITPTTIRSFPELFPKTIFLDNTYGEALGLLSRMEPAAFLQLTSPSQFYRFVGLLSLVDVAAVCCLLTIEHPEFTSETLRDAKLLNARGKYYLQLTDFDDSFILSLDKPRARQRKTVALTPLAVELITDVIKWTAAPRAVLRRAGNKAWRYLFLGAKFGGKLGPLDSASRLLHSPRALSLARLYPELRDAGLEAGTFDFRRIRTTMGVLRWFETGSIQEMARKLGNTYRVAMEHYLPAALLRAWNSRIIRRFQNLLIIIASSEEDYLLDVSDFSTIADLQHFIAQFLADFPENSSPLAVELHKRFGQTFSTQTSATNNLFGSSLLNIRLSPRSLAYLHAFSDLATSKMDFDQLNQTDPQSQLAPIQFVELSRLIRHACESDNVADELRELIDLVKLRQVNEQAMNCLPGIIDRFSQFTVTQSWSD